MTQTLKNNGFRVESDLRNEKIGFKIRELEIRKIPYVIIVGDKEMESGMVSVRARHGKDLGSMDLETLVNTLTTDVGRRGRVIGETTH